MDDTVDTNIERDIEGNKFYWGFYRTVLNLKEYQDWISRYRIP